MSLENIIRSGITKTPSFTFHIISDSSARTNGCATVGQRRYHCYCDAERLTMWRAHENLHRAPLENAGNALSRQFWFTNSEWVLWGQSGQHERAQEKEFPAPSVWFVSTWNQKKLGQWRNVPPSGKRNWFYSLTLTDVISLPLPLVIFHIQWTLLECHMASPLKFCHGHEKSIPHSANIGSNATLRRWLGSDVMFPCKGCIMRPQQNCGLQK